MIAKKIEIEVKAKGESGEVLSYTFKDGEGYCNFIDSFFDSDSDSHCDLLK